MITSDRQVVRRRFSGTSCPVLDTPCPFFSFFAFLFWCALFFSGVDFKGEHSVQDFAYAQLRFKVLVPVWPLEPKDLLLGVLTVSPLPLACAFLLFSPCRAFFRFLACAAFFFL